MRASFARGFEPPVKYLSKQMSRSANPATIKSHSPPLLCTLLSNPGCETGRSLALEPLAPKPNHAAIPHQPMKAEPPFSHACLRGLPEGCGYPRNCGVSGVLKSFVRGTSFLGKPDGSSPSWVMPELRSSAVMVRLSRPAFAATCGRAFPL
jgi:hypothetical protein